MKQKTIRQYSISFKRQVIADSKTDRSFARECYPVPALSEPRGHDLGWGAALRWAGR